MSDMKVRHASACRIGAPDKKLRAFCKSPRVTCKVEFTQTFCFFPGSFSTPEECDVYSSTRLSNSALFGRVAFDRTYVGSPCRSSEQSRRRMACWL